MTARCVPVKLSTLVAFGPSMEGRSRDRPMVSACRSPAGDVTPSMEGRSRDRPMRLDA